MLPSTPEHAEGVAHIPVGEERHEKRKLGMKEESVGGESQQISKSTKNRNLKAYLLNSRC